MIFFKSKSLLILLLLRLLPVFCLATSITSTAPGGTFTSGYQGSTPSAYTNGNLIRGHFMFKQGFRLDSTDPTTVTWDGDGIVNGLLGWNGSNTILNLASDLKLGSTLTFVGGGINRMISGGGNKIILTGDVGLNWKITPQTTDLTIDGQGHMLKVAANVSGSINVAAGITVTLKNMILDINSGSVSNFRFFDSSTTSNVILENVRVRCKSSLPVGIMGPGTLTIRGNVFFENVGGVIILTRSTQSFNLVIDKNSTLHVGKNTSLSLSGAAVYDSVLVSMTDQTSVLHLDGCDFYTSTSSPVLAGLNLLKGTVLFENKVRIFNAYYDAGVPGPSTTGNSDMTKGLIFGDATAANDVNVRMLGSAYVTVDGCMKYNHS
jgi:hypothetical protein